MNPEPFKLLSLPTLAGTAEAIKKFPFPVSLTRGSYKNISFILTSKEVKILVNDTLVTNFSFVWLASGWSTRDLAYAMWLYCKAKKIPCSYVEQGTSKISDAMHFALEGIATPATLFVNRVLLAERLDLVKTVCGYPLIIKDSKGVQGRYSKLVASEEELLIQMKTLPKNKRFIFQQYIANEYDWGIMVVNGTVVAGEKSYPLVGEFRNNAANGAKEVFFGVDEIPEEVKQMALKASASLGLSWSRADIIIDKGSKKPYLLEVNRYPGVTLGSDEVQGAYAFLSSHIAPIRAVK
jgi:hypothetical protein